VLTLSLQRPRRPADDGLSSFLFLWALVPIIFSAFPAQKLPGYILPAIPAATLLTADYLTVSSTLSRVKIALHSLLCAILLVTALIIPFVMMKQAPPFALQIGMTFTGALIAIMVLLMVRREGIRVLHFCNSGPTILAMAFLLRPAAATIDRTQSARAVQARLVELGAAQGTWPFYHV